MEQERVCKLLPCSPCDMPSVSAWLEKQAEAGLMFDSSFLSLCFFKRCAPVKLKFYLQEYDPRGYHGLGRLGRYTVQCAEDLTRPIPKFYNKSVLADGILKSIWWLFFTLRVGHWIYRNETAMFTEHRDTVVLTFFAVFLLLRIPAVLPTMIPALRGRYYRFPILRAVLHGSLLLPSIATALSHMIFG